MNSSFYLNNFEAGFPETAVAAIFLAINSVLCIISLCVYRQMILYFRRDNSEMKTLFIYYATANILFLPPIVILGDGLIPFWYPASENLGPWFCHLTFFVLYLYAFTIGIHTFLVALVRYIFILFDEHISGPVQKNMLSNSYVRLD